MMNKELTLTNLGLSEAESNIYLSLIQHGIMNISEISEQTKHHRPIIYSAISKLQERGLVSEILEGKRKKYQAAKPLKLYDLIDQIEDDLDGIVSELSERFQKNRLQISIEHFQGRSGLGHAFLDVVETLNRGDHFYRYSSAHEQKDVDSYVPKNYRKKRDAKQLTRDVITNRRAGNQKKLRPERNIKFIDTDVVQFRENIVQFIYGNKVSLLDFNTQNAYIIENEEVANFQKSIFKTLFEKL